ncbi:tyrosine-protein kinase domain-containing protein [Frankia nepalensis]|uniref:polysaccharide biosynthesis tyrosine autokinase n=1 Tax=Frankia nepalensis TaxID=1836974 RepID=UPI0027DE72C8|nr:polysaccharide biosynthesis tyrosine autokinase [Frankia nepalensis]
MELRDYTRVLRRGWLLVLVCVVLGGLLAALATWRSTKMYAASVTLVVSSAESAPDSATAYQGGLLSQQRIKSYASLVASDRVATVVIGRLGLAEEPDDLRKRIAAMAVPDTVLLRVSIRDSDPARARSLADTVGEVFADAVAAMEAPDDDNEPAALRITVWERAKLPDGPVAPQPVRNLALGIMIGLFVGIVAAFVRFRLDTTLADEEETVTITERPNLGAIVFETDAGRRPLIVHASPQSPRAEAFRQLRTNLRFVDVDSGPRSIVITSPLPAEGKSTTSCNLAITLAQGGARVCLVEGDLRRPSFGEYLGVESAAGLTSVLIGAAGIDDVLQPWGQGRVGAGCIDVLPSGPIPPNPSELLGSRGMAELIKKLTDRYDSVIIDAPPLLPVTDAAVLASRADGTLLVARLGRTRREQLRRAVTLLRAVDARVLGTVLNMIPTKGLSAYDYSSYFSNASTRGRHARALLSNTTRPGSPPSGRGPSGRPAAGEGWARGAATGAAGREPVSLTAITEQRSPDHDSGPSGRGHGPGGAAERGRGADRDGGRGPDRDGGRGPDHDRAPSARDT